MAAAVSMARGKYSSKYLRMMFACVSTKPTSRWHLNIARTRFTEGSGAGVAEVCADRLRTAPAAKRFPTKLRRLISEFDKDFATVEPVAQRPHGQQHRAGLCDGRKITEGGKPESKHADGAIEP